MKVVKLKRLAKMKAVGKDGATMINNKKQKPSQDLAPIEPGAVAPAAEKRRPDPKPFQRAWGAAGAAASSALLAAIVGPMVAAAGDGGFAIDSPSTTSTTGDGGATGEVPAPNYVYLQPGERAPEGAPVVHLDPISVAVAPQPGSTVVGKKPQRKVVYIYLTPGQTPPPGAIVQAAGTVPTSTPAPAASTTPGSGGGSGGGSATPKPTTPPPSTPSPATPAPVATPRPTPAPTPPPTKPSGP